jgi:5'-AMP-activated protein kinase catalytic alpha subunit
MTEVYKAMLALRCVWYQMNNYRVLCSWLHTPNAGVSGSGGGGGGGGHGGVAAFANMPTDVYAHRGGDTDAMDLANSRPSSAADLATMSSGSGGARGSRPEALKVKIALSLSKVQQSIYLLDFQRVEGDAFGFMKLCALIITELKNLSAASRSAPNPLAAAAAAAQQQQQQPRPPPQPQPPQSQQKTV